MCTETLALCLIQEWSQYVIVVMELTISKLLVFVCFKGFLYRQHFPFSAVLSSLMFFFCVL